MACGLKYVKIRNIPVPEATREPGLILADLPFKPYGVCTSCE